MISILLMFRSAAIVILLLCAKAVQGEVPVFNGENAFNYVKKQCELGYRYPGSVGHTHCLNFLEEELNKYADKTERQRFHALDPLSGKNLSLTNILAHFGTQSSRILLCAHWDTRPWADQDPDIANHRSPVMGANDGASGVAVLLELARLFKMHPPSIGVDIILFDGEDSGLEGDIDSWCLGSEYFARTKSNQYQPAYAILLDMVGDADLHLTIEQHSILYAPDVVDMVWSMAEKLGVAAFERKPGPIVIDDHLSLLKAGIPSIDIIDFSYPYWHTIQDTPDKCSAESLWSVGVVLAHLIYE